MKPILIKIVGPIAQYPDLNMRTWYKVVEHLPQGSIVVNCDKDKRKAILKQSEYEVMRYASQSK